MGKKSPIEFSSNQWIPRRWAPYIPVAQRRANAQKEAASLQKNGKNITPVHIQGRTIAKTFWGKAWCDHLESYSDFSNRLPRGRTYARNGSVIHLEVQEGKIEALVSGSSIYKISIQIKKLESKKWKSAIRECSGKIDSMIELLQGKFSQSVMEVLTGKTQGIFPTPHEIKMNCNCPDSAKMCKHIAATLYGIGARLDEKPELIFVLRKVDQMELISQADKTTLSPIKKRTNAKVLKTSALSNIFGIDLELDNPDTSEKKPKQLLSKKGRRNK